MNHKVFIPITDEMLYDYPQLITTPLRPYQIGNPCYHWMATIESPAQHEPNKINKIRPGAQNPGAQDQVESVRRFDHRMVLKARQPIMADETLQTDSRLV
ncbi:hypothetical protein [Candidatus Spongiihabitans sp.]|uniref:hypothetical protein n=1 Tax=Candidatus Spongiihabitans sp. TaxID=3101308 RepID=UPI003C7D53B6